MHPRFRLINRQRLDLATSKVLEIFAEEDPTWHKKKVGKLLGNVVLIGLVHMECMNRFNQTPEGRERGSIALRFEKYVQWCFDHREEIYEIVLMAVKIISLLV